MAKQQRLNAAAIYCRLSRDDGGDAESNSIQTQRIMLQKYAKDHGFSVAGEYIDDGVSGVTFERPSFKRMIADIEDDKIGIVLCKDLSRLGRNNALVAFYTEIFFSDHDVRFIAINDSIDSDLGDNEIMPFKSVINEYYARDISKKIRTSLKAKAQQGQFLGTYPPLGYLKSSADKHKLIVDDNTAHIVKYMFKLSAEGMGCGQIALRLRDDGIQTPREYYHNIGIFQKDGFNPAVPPKWNPKTVQQILINRAYLGCVVNNQVTTKSFKNKKRVELPESEWTVVPGMHEPLVDERTFDMAQRSVRTRQRKVYEKHDNIFAGFVKCPDCGASLSICWTHFVKCGATFVCNKYRTRSYVDGKICTAHYIPYDKLYEAVLTSIRQDAEVAKRNENSLREYAEKLAKTGDDKVLTQLEKELSKLKHRDTELDTIIRKLIEQNALGMITDERFVSTTAAYENEQAELKAKIADIQEKLTANRDRSDNFLTFLNLIKYYVEVPALDRALLNELIDKIVVHEATAKGKDRVQKLEIYYRFIGEFPR